MNNKFDRNTTYAIGILQINAGRDEEPPRFSKSSTPAIYITGDELISRKIKTVQDFLKKDCPFKAGSLVQFYEVSYPDGRQEHKHFYTGSPVLPITNYNSLNDDNNFQLQEKNNNYPLIPQNDGTSKYFAKSQADLITLLQKQNADERIEFNRERKDYIDKIDKLNDEIVSLNIQINTLKTEKNSLEIRCEEKEKFIGTLSQVPPQADFEPQNLADKTAKIDAMFGEGASQAIIAGIADGAGKGVGKAIEFIVDLVSSKVTNTTKPSNDKVSENNTENQNTETTTNI